MRLARLPDPKEAAILLLLLVDAREGATRVRLSEMTLKRLWGRRRLSDEFLAEVAEWLFRAGWALFLAKTTFAVVKTSVVHNWPRLSSKRIDAVIEKVQKGEFDFEAHSDRFSNLHDTDADA
jgi:hypothetical protein